MESLLLSIRWLDVIDILVVAYFFYKLITWIQGTRTLQMLLGLVVLLAALVISKWSNLYTINWLITSFWGQIILALVILFQPELRRALAKIGRNPFSTRLEELEEHKSLEEIIKAAVSLSSKRIGAIIVMERRNELREISEIGVQLDSKVSKEIISSIFLPYSPVHDGAIIINGSRIVAAGCFLPLTVNPNVGKHFGTRHRAALGITDETDAVVIVISEETGSVTVVLGGKMTRELDSSALRKVLTGIFVKKHEEQPFVKKLKNFLPQMVR